jgi:hypothetical protein
VASCKGSAPLLPRSRGGSGLYSNDGLRARLEMNVLDDDPLSAASPQPMKGKDAVLERVHHPCRGLKTFDLQRGIPSLSLLACAASSRAILCATAIWCDSNFSTVLLAPAVFATSRRAQLRHWRAAADRELRSNRLPPSPAQQGCP